MLKLKNKSYSLLYALKKCKLPELILYLKFAGKPTKKENDDIYKLGKTKYSMSLSGNFIFAL